MEPDPTRFTIELADLDAAVVVSDVSTVQLQLNELKVADAGGITRSKIAASPLSRLADPQPRRTRPSHKTSPPVNQDTGRFGVCIVVEAVERPLLPPLEE